ncbi:FAD-dependent oxidoreductase [Jatrophihabitans sp. YIM 134969]
MVIVGGGVAGPAVALAARQQGMDAVLLERRGAADPEAGSVVTVGPNGLDALDVLGVLDAVRQIGVPSRRNRMFGATGRLLGELSLGVPLADGTVALTVKRSALAVLLTDAARAAGAEIRYGAEVVDVEPTPDRVTVELADGATVAGDVLVGADGVRSRIRTVVDRSAPAARYLGLTNFGGRTLAADVPAGLDLAPEAWHFVFGHRSFTGFHPLPNGDVVWFVNVPRPEITREERASTSDATWHTWLTDLVADDAGPGPALVGAGHLELAGDNTWDLRRVPTWWRGRTVLVGDAVHAPAPSSGQGAAMALEDAVVLTRELAAHGPDGFARYEQARRARVEKIVANGARSSSAKIPGPIGRRVLETVLWLVFRTVATERSTAWITGYRLERPPAPARPRP